MPRIKTAISIRDVLFDETNIIANEMNVPRSQVISLALKEFIQRYRDRQLLRQINAAYEVPPSTDETESLEMMRAYQRKAV